MSRCTRLLAGALLAAVFVSLLARASLAEARVPASLGTPTLPPTPSPEPPTATAAVPTITAAPTATAAVPTATAAPTATATALPTSDPGTPVPPTSTPEPPPTSTPAPATSTPEPPPATSTPEPPTATAAPPARPPASPAVPTVPPPAPDIELIKRADRAEVAPGEQLIYSLLVRNLSDQPAADLLVSDTLPTQLAVISAQSDRALVELSGQRVTARLPALLSGESAEIQIIAQVRPDALTGELVNTARVTSSTPGDPPDNNTSSVTVGLVARPIQRLPHTAYAPDLLPLAAVPPLIWAALVGGLLFTLGGALTWGLRGWTRRAPGVRAPALRPLEPLHELRLPPAPPAGPPALGAFLPPARPPAPLPPLVQLDRDDALRDLLGE